MPTDIVSIAERIKANGITMSAERTDSNPAMEDSRDMDHWKCVIKMGHKRMTVVFSQGFGHNGKEPNVSNVLDCLASDAASVDNSPDFEDWCNDFGYEVDSRRAERVYKACKHQALRLHKFLDNLYDDFLYNTERE